VSCEQLFERPSHVVDGGVADLGTELLFHLAAGGQSSASYPPALSGELQKLRAAIAGVCRAGQEAARFHLVDHLDRRLFADAEQAGQLGEGAVAIGERSDDISKRRSHVVDAGVGNGVAEAVGHDTSGTDNENREVAMNFVRQGVRFAAVNE